MARPAIGAYLGALGDGDAELEALGTRIGKGFFRYAQRIVSGADDHWRFQLFAEYRDVPVYKAAFSGCFVLVAVEDDPGEGIFVTVMVALARQAGRIAGRDWDGRDMNFIRDVVLMPRLQDLFQ